MLEVNRLTKRYGSRLAVDDLNFSVGKFETIGLLGPNGAGKSTTMRMLTGFLAPTSGSVRVMGADLAEEPAAAKGHIGYLPELPPLYPDLTVEEHLGFVCGLRGLPRKQFGGEIGRVCESLNLSHVSRRQIGNLSKGYRQRVGCAAALVGSPKLLILDEPMVGLDPRQIVEMRGLIQGLSGGMTILLSSHILAEVASVCTRILIINGGHLLADGSPEEIAARHGGAPGVEAVVRGPRGGGEALALLRPLVPEGTRIEAQELRDGRTRFLLPAGQPEELCARVFHALAADGGGLTLLQLQPMAKTLEDIFMEITREAPRQTDGEEAVP